MSDYGNANTELTAATQPTVIESIHKEIGFLEDRLNSLSNIHVNLTGNNPLAVPTNAPQSAGPKPVGGALTEALSRLQRLAHASDLLLQAYGRL